MRSIFIALFLCTFASAQAQNGSSDHDHIGGGYNRAPSLHDLKNQADKSQKEGDYYAAMQYYGRMMAADSSNAISLKGYGDNAMQYSAFEQAEWAYQRMVDRNIENSDGAITLLLAKTKMVLGKFAEAEKLYRGLLFDNKPAGITPEISEKAQVGLENTLWAGGITKSGANIEATILKDINTEYSEIAPLMVGDTLYFSSYRFPFDDDKRNPKRHLTKVMSAVKANDVLQAGVQGFNESNRHTAQVTFNRENTVMYYSVCDFVNESAVSLRCALYMRERATPKSAWGKPIRLPSPINMDDYTTTEPNIGYTPDNREVLFFVSDRPGGQGGRDIWYAEKQSFGFGAPVNLSAINTAKEDVTPFYQTSSGTLYYSTDGLQTLGGLDIYSAKGYGTEWTSPKHLSMQINSHSNDAYFTVSKEGCTAYFASNRKGAQNLTEEACCFDIFTAELEKPSLMTTFVNKVDNQPLEGVTLKVVEVMSGVRREKSSEYVAGSTKRLQLDRLRTYTLVASKPGFETDSLIYIPGANACSDSAKLRLTPYKINLIVRVKDLKTKEDLLGTECTFVDQGAVVNNEVAAKDMWKEIKDKNETGNRYDYTLQYNHRYTVSVSKKGYTSSATSVTTEGLTGSQTIERLLLLNRGLDLVAWAVDSLVLTDTLDDVTFQLVNMDDEGEAPYEAFTNQTIKDLYKETIPRQKRYMLHANKPYYDADTVWFTTNNLKDDAFQTIYKQLVLNRFPIRLYFDNDIPKITRGSETEAATQYIEYYRKYITRKDSFILVHQNKPNGKAIQESLDNFFEKEVVEGQRRLERFSEQLKELLDKGYEIQLTLVGYASPLANADYNKMLTARRVSSVRKHFELFDGSIYAPYIKSGQLTLRSVPKGEISKEGINDDPKDRLQSVFSIPASRARRLEIIGININHTPDKLRK